MPTYETTKFLSLPQQVNKNKNDIETLQQNQADISNLIPNTEKGQPLGLATLDATGKVPPAQLPANPGNYLEKTGGTMEGSINMDGYAITNVNTIQSLVAFIEEIDAVNGETQVQVPLRMNNNKITGADKGTANGDVATVDNINDHNTSPFAHADIRNLISTIQGAYIYRGVINENTVDVTQISLTNRLTALMSRAPILGDVLTDLDRTDWYFDGTSWDNMGQTFVVLASAVNDGLMSKEDYTKLFDLYTKAQLDATFEVLANKAIDFSTVNDTKYPTTKAVSERLLNLPIAELNNHTLREVFEGGQLITNADFTSSDITWWSPRLNVTASGGKALFVNPNGGDSYLVKNGLLVNGNIYYIVTNVNNISNTIRLDGLGVSNTQIPQGITKQIRTATSNNFTLTRNTAVGDTNVELDYVYMYNLTSLGISSLTVAQMDYWFNVYQALIVSDTNAIFSLFAPKQQEAWITPTLTTATSTYIRYRKDTLGTVIVEGNITVTTAGTNLTLPVGYRPLFAYTVGILTFNTNGTVVSSATGTQTLSVRYTGA